MHLHARVSAYSAASSVVRRSVFVRSILRSVSRAPVTISFGTLILYLFRKKADAVSSGPTHDRHSGEGAQRASTCEDAQASSPRPFQTRAPPPPRLRRAPSPRPASCAASRSAARRPARQSSGAAAPGSTLRTGMGSTLERSCTVDRYFTIIALYSSRGLIARRHRPWQEGRFSA